MLQFQWAILKHLMAYGSAVWGGPLCSKCDTVQQRATRTMLGVGRQTPIPFLYFDLGWTPPNILQKLETVRLGYSIINSPDYRLPKRIFT